MRTARPRFVWRSPMGVLAVLLGVIACSGIITGPDGGPDTSPRSMNVSPARLELSLTDTARMRANLYDVTGAAAVLDPAIPVRFRSADTLIARVDASGLVTAVADGTTIVTASYGAISLGIPVVVLGRPRIVVVSGDAQSAEQGDTLPQSLVIRALDAAGLPVANGAVTFRIEFGGGALFAVQSLTDVNGNASARWVLGLPLGAQTVSVTRPGSDSALFSATSAPGTRPSRVAIAAPLTTLAGPAATTTMTAAVFNVANVALPAAPVTWTSKSPAIASVSGTGLVTAVAPGTAYIRASSGAAADSVLVTVSALPIIAVAPASLAYAWSVGDAASPAQAIAVTNAGGGTLTGLSSSIVYGAGASDWLSLALAGAAAPATLTATPVPGSIPAGSYTATITVASTIAGVASRSIAVALTVSPRPVLPKLQFGADFAHPAGLQVARTLVLPSALLAAQSFTLRSLDTEAVLLAADSVTLGGSSINVSAVAGANSVPFWVQGMERSSGTIARMVGEAVGFAPDTIDVTMVRPAARLTLVGPSSVPASGGADPVLQVTVGRNDAGALVTMPVRAFGVAPTFDVLATDPIALMQFRATAATVGVDQGPTLRVTFDLRPGESATTLPNLALGVPASLGVVRSGAAGTAAFVLSSLVTEYDIIGGNPSLTITALPVPVIAVAPASLTFTATAGAGDPPAQQVAITNGGAGTLSGLSTSVVINGLPNSWLPTVTLDVSTAPATLTVAASTAGVPPGTYTATITVASSDAGVAPVPIPVTFVVATDVLPKLALGPDLTHPAGLQAERSVSVPSAGVDPVMVTLRSLDPSGVLVGRSAALVGAAIDSTEIEGGTDQTSYWMSGLEGTAGRAVTLIATAPGYAPDTMVVTLKRPSFQLLPFGTTSVPATGGEDPVLVLGVGDVIIDAFVPMAVRIGGTPPSFTLTSQAPAVARLRFVAGSGVVGADQGPADQITFGIAGGTNRTSDGQFVSSPANIRLARTGTAGTVQVDAVGSAEYDGFLTGVQYAVTSTAVPVLSVAPTTLTYAAQVGATTPLSQQVAISNAGGGTLSGLSAAVLYGAGASDWLSVALNASTAPAMLTVVASTGFIPVGTFTATITLASTTPGVAPLDLPVTLTITAAPRLEIVSGDGQIVRWGQVAVDSIKVRAIDAGGSPLSGGIVDFAISANGGLLAPTSAVTDANGFVATQWQAGTTLGAFTMTASRSGYTSAVFSGTVAAGTFVTRLQVTAPRTALSGAGDAVQFSATAFNLADSLIASAAVTWASRTPATATVSPTGLVTAVAAGQTWIVASSDDGRDSALVTVTIPVPPIIGVVPDSLGFSVIAGATTGTAQTSLVSNIGGGSLSGLEANVSYGAGASDWLFVTLGADVPATLTVSPQPQFLAAGAYRAIIEIRTALPAVVPETVVVTMTVTAPVTTITLDIPGEDLVGVGSSTLLGLTLGAPAPAGGLVVTVTSDNASSIGVAAPGTVTIGAGQSTGQIQLTGLSVGSTVIRANAAGYSEGSLPVVATNQIISLPTTLNVPYGLTTSIPVQLATPAPAGGVVVTLSSSNPSAVGVVTSTVTLPQGATLASGTLSGAAPGAATITATATGWVSDATTATTTASLNVVEPFLGINATFGGTMTIELRSGASAIGAPAPGVTVALTALNAACVAVPATVTIPTGQTAVTAAVSYGGTATTPCTSFVRATATNMQADSVSVTVAAPPTISAGGATLGAGLQAQTGASLSASNFGATTMRIESSNPALVLIAPNTSTVGSAFIDVPLTAPSTSASYVIQALEGVTGTATVTASAPGFTSGTATVTVRGLGVELLSLPATTTTFSPNGFVQARIGGLNAAGTTIENEYGIRAGGVPLTLTVTNSDAAVAQLVTTALTGQSVTAVIGVGQTRLPFGTAAGGIEFDPIAGGTTTVSVSTPGITTLPGASQTVTVVSPFVSAGGATLGAGLQAQTGASLSASNFGTTTMRIESSNPALVLIAPNTSTVGSAFIDVPLTAPSTSASYVIQALEGVTGTATVTASAPGFTSGTATVTVRGLGVELLSLPATTTTFSPNGFVQARIGGLNAAGTTIENEYGIRAGGVPLTLTVTNSDAAVAQLVTTALTGQSVTAVIGVGQTRLPFGTAAGGIEFDPIAGGTTTVSVSTPGITTLPGASQTVTVVSPFVSAGGATLGAGLQAQTGASLSASNFGTTTMRIESSNPALVLIAPNASTVGSAFIDIPLTSPNTNVGYVIQALEGVTGTATVTASAPGFTSGTATVTVRGLGVELLSVPTTTTSLSPNAAFQARIGTLNAAGTTIESEYAIRTGGSPFTATFTNSNSTVAQLVTTALTGQSVTATIGVGQSRTPFGLVAGGVEFDPLSSGSTTVSVAIPGLTSGPGASATTTISAPAISAGGATIGAGLQTQTSASLGASNFGTTTVRIESSNPALVLIAPNATTVGSAFIDVPLTAPNTNVGYVIQALEGVTGTATVTASAPGFTSGTATVTVRGLGVELLSAPTTTTTLSPNAAFQARVGVLNVAGNTIEGEYAIRAGGTPLTATFTNGNASTAQLVTTAVTGQSVTATIGIGQTRTPFGVASGGVEFDPISTGSTIMTVAIPGVTSLAGASQSITVVTPAITAGGATLGSGLQTQTSASLGASNFGAVTVRIESSNPALVLIAPNASTVGSAFIDVPLTSPSTNVSYVLQALEGVTGTATVTVTAAGFTQGSATVTVRGLGVDLISVPASTGAAATNSTFQARIGALNAAGTAIEQELALRAGGAPLTVTVTNSNATAARLVTAALTGQSVTATIAIGQTRTPAGALARGIEFDPLAGGTTTLSASVPGATATPDASRTVVITP